MNPDTIISLSSGAAGFAIGAIFAIFAVGILRLSSYDAGWKEGHQAGVKAARAEEVDAPSILRTVQLPNCSGWEKEIYDDKPPMRRRHHTMTHEPAIARMATAGKPAPELPAMDDAATAALADWSEVLRATGSVKISFVDMAATYPVPVAARADLIRWIKLAFPKEKITLWDHELVVSKV